MVALAGIAAMPISNPCGAHPGSKIIEEWTMRRVLQLAAIILVVGLAGAVAAQDANLATKIDTLLGGVEYVPTAQEWKALGPDTAGVLRGIASSESERPSRRARSLSALGYFPSAETRTFLEAMANDNGARTVFRRKALRALAFGYKGEALVFVSKFVAAEDKHLRDAAMKSLADIGTPEAQTALKARLKVEKAEFVRETIEQSLAR
jgi:HEAT repeat protein